MSAIAQGVQDLFETYAKRLGGSARLGIYGVLLAPNGEKRADVEFNQYERFPMASVVKVPLAMLVASQVANGSLSLDEEITIQSRAASPGLMANPVDRLYFLPFDAVRTYSVEQLTGFMLRNSDNTATDALLHRLGGTAALTEFLVHELHVDGICLERTMHELLTHYYSLDRCDVRDPHQNMWRRIGRIVGNIRQMTSPYVCRLNPEEHLVDSGEDTSTPRAIAEVLKRLLISPKYALVYSHMQHCATNKRRIAEGLRQHRPIIKSFGHKTGSIGAIANDVGIIHFNSGHSAVIAVLTCLSSARMPVRDEQIAGVTCAIIRQWKKEYLLETPSRLES